MKNLLTFALCILSYALPASTTDSPIACNLGVLSAEQRKQHEALGRKIFSSVLAQRRTLQAIERIATQPRLTMLVGAGASAEAGFPTWGELIESLLDDVADAAGVPADER